MLTAATTFRSAWLVWAATALVLGGGAGCAKQGAPPGGPEDRTPPELVESTPGAGATDVPVTAPIRLVFSEKLDRRSLERGLLTTPKIRWANRSWSGAEVTLVPADSLYPDSTYVITIGAGVQDRRSNPLGTPVVIAFSTGADLPRNVLVGRVVRGGRPSAGAGVSLYVWHDDRETDPEVDVPYRQTQTDPEGNFVLPYVEHATRAYELFAYNDANRTGAFEEGDPWGFFPEPITVPALPETTGGVEVNLWDSKSTGRIVGRIDGDWHDTGNFRLELTSPGDSTATRSEEVREPGPFRWYGIPPGTYFLSAYQDVNANETWDDVEEMPEIRLILPDTLEVIAGEAIRDIEIRAPRRVEE